MQKPIFPNPEEINAAIKKLDAKKYFNKLKAKKSDPTKEGIDYCVALLKDRLKNPDNPYFIAESEEQWDELNEIFKSQVKGIEKLKEMKSRAMAILCVDWLNGNKEAINFINQK